MSCQARVSQPERKRLASVLRCRPYDYAANIDFERLLKRKENAPGDGIGAPAGCNRL